jgi:hypothetical protein
MKRSGLVILVTACFLVFSGTVFASQENTGCGLGSIIFEGQDGLISQTCAFTTNGTFLTNAFGITSGTSNCEQYTTLASNQKLNTFVADNMDSLAKDIARGNGEYLNTLAVLAEIPQGERPALYKKLQANFGYIYDSDDVSHIDVLQRIDSLATAS